MNGAQHRRVIDTSGHIADSWHPNNEMMYVCIVYMIYHCKSAVFVVVLEELNVKVFIFHFAHVSWERFPCHCFCWYWRPVSAIEQIKRTFTCVLLLNGSIFIWCHHVANFSTCSFIGRFWCSKIAERKSSQTCVDLLCPKVSSGESLRKSNRAGVCLSMSVLLVLVVLVGASRAIFQKFVDRYRRKKMVDQFLTDSARGLH